MDDNDLTTAARSVAERLAGDLGPDLPAAVEAQLHAGGEGPKRFDLATLIALAALIVNGVRLARDIYGDLHQKTKAVPAADVVARRIRISPELETDVPAEQRDKIITAIVKEVMKHPPAGC